MKFKREAMARYVMRVQAVAEAVETAFFGQEVSRVLEGEAAFDLVVRYDPAVPEDLDAVRATLITTPSGAQVPLHVLAEIRKDHGPNTISRENVQRRIVVMSNVAGRDLHSVVDDIRTRIQQAVSLPAGYHIEYGG
jgi:Cu/Ag efflux pump CusA